MTCPKCQREVSACGCQASLLPPPPEWRRELQHRMDAYRARRRNQLGARVLEFPPDARPQRRPRTVTEPLGEPLADPVALPRAEPAPISVMTRAAWEPHETTAAGAVRLPLPAAENELAEAVVMPLPHRADPQPALPVVAARGEAVLQLPLPMAAPAAPALPPPAVAPRSLRLEAALVDAAVVALASVMFALTAWSALGFPRLEAHFLRLLLPAFVLAPGMLAAVYLLACAYAGGATIGMRAFGLQVVNFDGSPLGNPAMLRRRAWASLISMAAFGLGYIWAYCDFQQLTWHDYITRTCVGEIQERDS